MSTGPAPDIAPPVKVLIMIFDARDEWEGVPLDEAVVQALERFSLAGATVFTGVKGYGAHRGLHHKGLIDQPHDRPERSSSSRTKPSSEPRSPR